MDKAAWRERFRLEQGSLAEEILRDLPRWSREELFRFFHSLRSQADFFHWESLSRTAEAGEDCLAGEAVETGRVREVLESLRETLNQGGGRQPVGRGIPAGAGRIAGGGLRPGAGGLSRRDIEPFAYTLLQEARERGEVPYHLSCRISREEPLPYARFFLIISRLEEMVNVIQVFPDLKTLEENPVDAVSLLISTRTGEEEIRRAVDVDNLERLTFIPMAYEDLLVPTDSLPGEEGEK